MTWLKQVMAGCTLAVAGLNTAAAVPLLSLVPTSPSVIEGAAANVDLIVSGLDNEFIGTYDLSFAWNPGLLALSSVTFDTYLDGPVDSISGFNTELGTLSIFEVSLGGLSNQLGLSQFRLFSLGFQALDQGLASIAFSGPVQIVGNELGEAYEGWSARVALVNIAPPATSVPEPAALGLLAGCLAGIFFGQRRRRPLPAAGTPFA